MFFDSVFPVILVLQALVLHIACVSMTTFCISGQQMHGFKAAVFKVASVCLVVQQVVLLFHVKCSVFCHRSALPCSWLFERILLLWSAVYGLPILKCQLHWKSPSTFHLVLCGLGCLGFWVPIPFHSSRYCYCITLFFVSDDISYSCDWESWRWFILEKNRQQWEYLWWLCYCAWTQCH